MEQIFKVKTKRKNIDAVEKLETNFKTESCKKKANKAGIGSK